MPTLHSTSALRWRLVQSTLDGDPVRFRPGLTFFPVLTDRMNFDSPPNFVYHAADHDTGSSRGRRADQECSGGFRR